jgi:HK97 family phage major capsid protein
MVMNQFETIRMPTNPYDLPVQESTTRARIQAENATITDAQFSTGKITMSATKLAEFYVLSSEIDEDSAPPILALARKEVTMSQFDAAEAALISGDDSGTHFDDDIDGGAADLAEKAWKGIRKLAFANSANGGTVDFVGAAITLAKCRDMRTQMGKYGVNPADLRWIVSPKTINGFLALDEVTTVEKYGNAATVVTGEIGRLDGIPIITSEFQRDDVASTGVNTGAGPNTFSCISLVNRKRFYMGVRRPLKTKITFHPVPPNDQWLMASWWRADFKGHTQDAGEVSTVLGHNIV